MSHQTKDGSDEDFSRNTTETVYSIKRLESAVLLKSLRTLYVYEGVAFPLSLMHMKRVDRRPRAKEEEVLPPVERGIYYLRQCRRYQVKVPEALVAKVGATLYQSAVSGLFRK